MGSRRKQEKAGANKRKQEQTIGTRTMDKLAAYSRRKQEEAEVSKIKH